MRKSEFANAVQVSTTRGAFGRHGRHPPRPPCGHCAPHCPSRVDHRLGRRAEVVGSAGGTRRHESRLIQLSAATTCCRPHSSRASKGMGQEPALPPNHACDSHPASQPSRRPLRRGYRLSGAVRSAMLGRLAGSRLIGEAKPREWAARWLFSERVATTGAHVIEQDYELGSGHRSRRSQASPALAAIRPASRSMGRESPCIDSWPNLCAHQPRCGLGRKALARRTLCCRR